MTEPTYLSTTEAAELLGVTAETMRQWAKARKLRHVRLPSGQLRFTRADVDAALTPVEPSPAPVSSGSNQ